MSSRKNTLPAFKILSAGDLSQATVTSAVTAVPYLDNIGIEVIATGAPVGVFAVQCSIDYTVVNGVVSNAGTWVNIGTGSVSAADTIIFEINQCPAPYVRVLYTKTSGTGAADIWITGKQV